MQLQNTLHYCNNENEEKCLCATDQLHTQRLAVKQLNSLKDSKINPFFLYRISELNRLLYISCMASYLITLLVLVAFLNKFIYIYITSRARESETTSALAWTIDEKERVAGAGFTRQEVAKVMKEIMVIKLQDLVLLWHFFNTIDRSLQAIL